MRRGAGGRRGSDASDQLRGRLRAHDPFELIRWLAFSQPDPRKALAELVQNSLDAGARRIRVTRVRERGSPCLRIFDDGEGVIPEMDRREALRYVATHIGHSRKRSLSPQQRLTLMTQGQYGIGLLGFWSLGETLEMRTSLPGQRPCRLVLRRDSPDFRIEPLRGRLPLDGRWTEVLVVGLHREAMAAVGARRAADFLASELRGQLLSRQVDLVIEDRISRGRAQKLIPVRPPRFLGERIEGLSEIRVAGHPGIRLEIYIRGDSSADEAEARGIGVYSAGTLVAEGFHDLAALGLDREPWTDPRLTGLVDFPGFQVTPGSRRGVVPDEAAGAFTRALAGVEPILRELLEALARRKREELDRSLIRDLQRAFRDFYRQRPRYALLPVEARPDQQASREASESSGPGGGGGFAAGPGAEGDAPGPGMGGGPDADADAGELPQGPPADLLPAGPLDAVRIAPCPVRVECGGARRVRAIAVDASGRTLAEPVTFTWSLGGDVGELDQSAGHSGRVVLRAASSPARGRLAATARTEDREATAEAEIEIVEELPSRPGREGIPEPELVHEPGAPWRSRMQEGRWQVNTGHRDYRGIADRPALKLRYLAMLFAKEVVLRSSQDLRLEKPLEQLVEVSAFADRNLAATRPRRRAPTAGE